MPDYHSIKRLGAGQFGEVWLVFDRALGEQRAVKFVKLGRISHPSNFYDEPQILRSLSHENIVAVQDAGTLPDGSLYIAMEFMQNGSLQDIMQGGIYPLRESIRVVCDICRAVEYAHNHSYLHRDIKPANILIAQDGSGKLSDFGLATKMSDSGGASPYGYLVHLAPEIYDGSETSRLSDIYSLGVTLYRSVNGDAILPTYKDNDELGKLVMAGAFPDRTRYQPFVPKKLMRIINKAMAVKPTERFSTAADFRHALEQQCIHCNWTFQATQTGIVWIAQSARLSFEATITTHKSGHHDFQIRKGTPGATMRRISNDCAYGLDSKKLHIHVQRVLSRISETGK